MTSSVLNKAYKTVSGCPPILGWACKLLCMCIMTVYEIYHISHSPPQCSHEFNSDLFLKLSENYFKSRNIERRKYCLASPLEIFRSDAGYLVRAEGNLVKMQRFHRTSQLWHSTSKLPTQVEMCYQRPSGPQLLSHIGGPQKACDPLVTKIIWMCFLI